MLLTILHIALVILCGLNAKVEGEEIIKNMLEFQWGHLGNYSCE